MAIISVIVAVAEDRAIGKDNSLLCRLPNDLKYFKSLTMGHTIIMGRKTFLSLPGGALPGRNNIVLSRSQVEYPATTTCHSVEEAIEAVKDENEVFFIGGAQIYEQVLKYAQKLYITEIHAAFPDADAHFPSIDKSEWQEVSRQENEADEKHKYPYSFVCYQRR